MGQPSANMQGTMTSVYNLGCFAGAMSTVWTGDLFGRPRQILIGSTIIAIGGSIQAAFQAFGRPRQRICCLTIGRERHEDESLRRSDWFGKDKEVLEVIAVQEGNNSTPKSPSVKTQFNVIKDILDRENMNSYTWIQLLSGRGPAGVLRRMVLGAWMQAMNQISGINVTSYYMSYIFINALNISELLSRILAAAGSIDYLVFSCLAYFVIERYGRRKAMMSSALACSTCWVVITIAMSISDRAMGDEYKFAFFAKINALGMRTKGASFAMATNWIMNYMVVQVTPPGIVNLGWRFWIIWAVICFSFISITYVFYLETANRTLEDIDRFFSEKPGIMVARNKTATQLHRPEEYIFMDEEIAKREQCVLPVESEEHI
ncbi:hypothetical protein ACO22_02125 [Paracoccidioides brasiliensis]|uniref:Major facilitator superfamily (MFS) profile domain-containing protein n=1 Tax=Paracoccidioides brasiliensis TaxID=121759 RepID=A0A1D2JJP8_PARBR|nr:hypothetical protein ACO22_02125 [Paracoccidioides brasiliensis]